MKEYINGFRLAMGTASYCKTCKALMTSGVNNPEVAKSLGIEGPIAWARFLEEHEAYHKAKGEELPESWTVRALDAYMLARIEEAKEYASLAHVIEREYHKGKSSEELQAIRAFKQAARPVVKQVNHQHAYKGERDDVRPFAGF